MTVKLSVDDGDHALPREQVQLPGSSMRNFKQKDDDCVSENSFGSDFGDDEEGLYGNIESDLPPPVYSENAMVLQRIPPTGSTKVEPTSKVNILGPSMCIICKVSPAHSQGGFLYPTCRALTCASKIRKVPIATLNTLSQHQIPLSHTGIAPSSTSSPSQGSAGEIKMCNVCHIRPRYQKGGKSYPTCGLTCAAASKSQSNHNTLSHPSQQPSPYIQNGYIGLLGGTTSKTPLNGHLLPSQACVICHVRPRFQKGGKNYPTCGLTCAAALKSQSDNSSHHSQQPSQAHRLNGFLGLLGGLIRQTTSTVHQLCVVCLVNPCRDSKYVTCGMKCAETLCKRGNYIPTICDYCHRRPKVAGYNQCSETCRDKAKIACLLCRCRPKFGRYPFCGRMCKNIATKWTRATPIFLEARPGHTIFDEVEQKFKLAWKGSAGCPPIKKIYKIIENKAFTLPYDRYKKRVGNEALRYHGTPRGCTLGSPGNTRLCSSSACALCSILRTSFKVSQSGAFGTGIYTSSTTNKAYSYTNGGKGAIIVTKVVLGTVYKAKARHQVKTCPPHHNSVVFDEKKFDDTTVVYTNDAIRPIFLIFF